MSSPPINVFSFFNSGLQIQLEEIIKERLNIGNFVGIGRRLH